MIRTIQRLLAKGRSRSLASDGFTLVELLVVVVISGIIVATVAEVFIVGAKTTTASKVRLDESHDAQMASAYFVADASSATYFSTSTRQSTTCSDANTAVGESDVALFEWTDAAGTKSAYYIEQPANSSVNPGSYPRLVRRYCASTATSVDLPLVKNLSSTTPTVTCPLDGSCSSTPSAVQLTLTENSGYQVALRASSRYSSITTGGALGGIAAYVGSGGLNLGGNSTLTAKPGAGIVEVTGGDLTCNGAKSVVAADGVEQGGGGKDTKCDPPVATNPVPDPLRNVSVPTKPGAPDTSPNTKPCSDQTLTTYYPGDYPATWGKKGNQPPTIQNACLASGTYWFDGGATLSNVTAAPGGVLIYVQSGDLSVDTVKLAPMTTGNQAGVAIFFDRSNASSVNVGSNVLADGIIYAASGTLSLQSQNSALTTGGLDVQAVNVQGNGAITIQ